MTTDAQQAGSSPSPLAGEGPRLSPSPLAGEGRGEGGSPAPREVTIPRQIVVRCPLQRFDLRRAHQCDGCPHFAGLAEAPARPDAGFHERFQVRCAYPTDRTLFRLRD